MKNFLLLLLPMLALVLSTCTTKPKTLFRLLSSEKTGIRFENTVTETDSFNILTYDYIYNGGGVGVADFNNDGRADIFFSGNQKGNKLYLNKGNMKFDDVTGKSNVNIQGRWNSGVAIIDINNDGKMDIYVCATTNPNPSERRNMLFVNQGNDALGEPAFKEMAAEYKIDFNGHSVMAAFLDYDHDGDQDLYILVNEKSHKSPTAYHFKIDDGTAANNDRLFRNNGDNTFSDVTIEAGITAEGYGLGLAVADFNRDGWPDLYVSNDFLTNDILYLNNQHGKFINETARLLGHESQFSMGNDAADINNDALVDIITLDMLPEANERKKTTIGNKSYLNTINNERFNYQYQYVRNMVQINNGADKGFKFSEIGQLAGVYQTEWSWAPLFMDVDNDGNKDLTITNGFPKDINDKDFANYRNSMINFAKPSMMMDSIPIVKVPNYAFRNNGDLTFTDRSKEWGLNMASFSSGAAFADLDNDGDLDYVINNINSEAFVYENTLYSSDVKPPAKSNYLRLNLRGPDRNKLGLGTKVYLYYDSGKVQFQDHSIYRGYLSSVEQILHFGLGKTNVADSLIVEWPDGKREKIKRVKVNQTLKVVYSNATEKTKTSKTTPALFHDVSKKERLLFKQNEKDVIDFNIQRTIPHKFSEFGPALAVGDINGDGLEDLFVGGPTGISGTFFIQEKAGGFSVAGKRFTDEKQKIEEDEGALLFDADNDDDLDLYIVSGGFEWPQESINYRHRLYKNDGKGFFRRDANAIPAIQASGSCVRAADYDGDGDLDLFVAGRVLPGSYPFAPQSFILSNDHGKFTDVTDEICPALKTIGMVSDALWSDFDDDGKPDLIIAGELMPVTFVRNQGSTFSVITSVNSDYKGWWNSIAPGDYDHDGDVDYVVGNLGHNNYYQVTREHPLKVFAKDLDQNGSVDAITGCYFKMLDGSMKFCPAHFWDELNSQSPRFRRQFSKYKQFGAVTMNELLSAKDLEGALILEANYSSTSYFENLGNGKFKITQLPVETQEAPVTGILSYDCDDDGNLDLLMVGNEYGNEVFTGRYDAFNGLILKGDGRGGFSPMRTSMSGFYVPHDAKALVRLATGSKEDIFVASQNKDSLKVFAGKNTNTFEIAIERLDMSAVVSLATGKKEKVEFYYGNGFLSQSTRSFKVPDDAVSIEIRDFTGKIRKITPGISTHSAALHKLKKK